MKFLSARMFFLASRRLWIAHLLACSTRTLAALAVLFAVVHLPIEDALRLELNEDGQLVSAQEAKHGEARVKVKGVRTIPLDAPEYAHVMAWAPDSRRLAVGGLLDKRMSVWDVQTGQRLPGPADQMGGIHALAYSPDGRYLAVARGAVRAGPRQPVPIGPERYVVSLWEGQSGAWLQNLVDERQALDYFGVGSIVFSSDGKYLAVTYTRAVALYTRDGSAWKQTSSLGPGALALSFSPDGRRLIGSRGGIPVVYELPSLNLLETWAGVRVGTESGPARIAYRPDGMQIAVCDGVRLGIFDPATGQIVRKLEPTQPYLIESLSYSPDNRWLAVASTRVIQMLDTTDWSVAARLVDHRPIVQQATFSPDGRLMAAVGGGSITIWELTESGSAER